MYRWIKAAGILLTIGLTLAVLGCDMAGDSGVDTSPETETEKVQLTLDALNPEAVDHAFYRFDKTSESTADILAADASEFIRPLNTWIFSALFFQLDAPGEAIQEKFTYTYYSVDGDQVAEFETSEKTIDADSEFFTLRIGYGSAYPGWWQPGMYIERITTAGGTQLSSQQFSVTAFSEAPFTPQVVGTGTPGGWPDDDVHPATGYPEAEDDQYMTQVSENEWSYSWTVTEAVDLELKVRNPDDWDFAYSTNNDTVVQLGERFDAYLGQGLVDTTVSTPGAGTVTVTLWFNGEDSNGRPHMQIDFSEQE